MYWQITDRMLTCFRGPLVMGIVNVTPDSFSDGGKFFDSIKAIAHALNLIDQGADLLDIGGESTRPGSQPVSVDEQLNRILPVVENLTKNTDVLISIDTSQAEVAERCLHAGAHIINDVTALTGDARMATVVADAKAGLVMMHMQGTPATMQHNPQYDDVVDDVRTYLKSRIEYALAEGIGADQIAVDPGVGFGKNYAHNMQLIAELRQLRSLQRPICLGVSRKGFIGQTLDRSRDQRTIGSVAIACHAMTRDALHIVRVHDVRETADAVRMLTALRKYEYTEFN